ncbi:hypothetical protein [Bradyrhizobium sp. SYSU BS000235]|uniref:hypothetical protein n=1 Tax=Bradyrhizobium sp. SYSU BS000235 TaxID=3411332 RepID=UPI003C71291E
MGHPAPQALPAAAPEEVPAAALEEVLVEARAAEVVADNALFSSTESLRRIGPQAFFRCNYRQTNPLGFCSSCDRRLRFMIRSSGNGAPNCLARAFTLTIERLNATAARTAETPLLDISINLRSSSGIQVRFVTCFMRRHGLLALSSNMSERFMTLSRQTNIVDLWRCQLFRF